MTYTNVVGDPTDTWYREWTARFDMQFINTLNPVSTTADVTWGSATGLITGDFSSISVCKNTDCSVVLTQLEIDAGPSYEIGSYLIIKHAITDSYLIAQSYSLRKVSILLLSSDGLTTVEDKMTAGEVIEANYLLYAVY